MWCSTVSAFVKSSIQLWALMALLVSIPYKVTLVLFQVWFCCICSKNAPVCFRSWGGKKMKDGGTSYSIIFCLAFAFLYRQTEFSCFLFFFLMWLNLHPMWISNHVLLIWLWLKWIFKNNKTKKKQQMFAVLWVADLSGGCIKRFSSL